MIDKDHGTLLIKNLDHRETFGDVTCIASNAAGSSVAYGHLSVLREYFIFNFFIFSFSFQFLGQLVPLQVMHFLLSSQAGLVLSGSVTPLNANPLSETLEKD